MKVRAFRRSMLLGVAVATLFSSSLASAQCQPGTYASASTGSCEPCIPGEYQPAMGQESCFQCEAGRFTSQPGRTACSQCTAGRFSNLAGATDCATCAAGTFRDATGQTSCVACEAGRFSALAGPTFCGTCAAGRFSHQAGLTSCAACDAGKYASDGASSCRSCDAGKYADASGGSVCRSCSPGKYSDAAEATACTSCPPGKFSGVTVDALGEAHYASTCTAPNAYACFKTKDEKSPPFVPSSGVALETDFSSSLSGKIKGPAMVCAPVDVGSGVADPNGRQCCYKVAAPGLPKPHPRVRTSGGTYTGSQLEMQKVPFICEPCATTPAP